MNWGKEFELGFFGFGELKRIELFNKQVVECAIGKYAGEEAYLVIAAASGGGIGERVSERDKPRSRYK